jgi:hypothetical protein
MAVVAGTDKPTAAQYNGVQTTINAVLATNYGQTPDSSQIALPGTSTKITATAWGNLRADILRANRHQLNPAAVGTLTNPTTSTKIAAADFNAYETMANACLTNYLLFPDNSTLSSTVESSSAWLPSNGSWGATGRNTLKLDIQVTLAAYPAPFYFNSGGQIRFSSTFTGGTVATPGTKDYSWKSAVNEMGSIIFGANSTRTLAGATGAGTGSSIGWYQLTGTNQLIYTKNTSTYTPNTIKIYARYSAPIIYFTLEYEDLNDPGGYGIDEDVSATVTTYVTRYYATGTGEVDVTNFSPSPVTIGTSVLASPNP